MRESGNIIRSSVAPPSLPIKFLPGCSHMFLVCSCAKTLVSAFFYVKAHHGQMWEFNNALACKYWLNEGKQKQKCKPFPNKNYRIRNLLTDSLCKIATSAIRVIDAQDLPTVHELEVIQITSVTSWPEWPLGKGSWKWSAILLNIRYKQTIQNRFKLKIKPAWIYVYTCLTHSCI